MAHQPTFRPDPLRRSQPPDEHGSVPSSQPRWIEEGDRVHLAELAATLASYGGEASATELALDLFLNQIVEQARLATGAAGGFIALAREGEMVCRATTGVNAPGLGVRLDPHSALSGACIQTREVQRCDDVETDPRVDAESCRRLELRSILVVPVLKGEELLGVFEVFSPHPSLFGPFDIQTVRALCRRIVDNIQDATEAAAPPVVACSSSVTASVDEIQAELLTALSRPEPEPQERRVHSHDYGTGVLTAIVVALALLVGWMVGRAGWQTAIYVAKTKSGSASPAQEPEDAQTAAASDVRRTQPAARKQPAGSAGLSSSRAKNETEAIKSGTNAASTGGLIVYEKGKVIFQMTPAQKSHPSATEPAAETSRQDENVKESDFSLASNPVPVSAETASAYLIHRIEPQYPTQAREQHIQGPVVLSAVVNKDGSVEVLKVVSGDPQLVSAAADAVRHWRFRPYRPHGEPVEFETQIKVNFALP